MSLEDGGLYTACLDAWKVVPQRLVKLDGSGAQVQEGTAEEFVNENLKEILQRVLEMFRQNRSQGTRNQTGSVTIYD
eukprot:CAMPEP_0168318694 /NCGR_PEP_ID=MMETSP0213-20121227/627_1 /TAXON_ID=151035 /ORGANISM="Euplotes harpa, Strain FSP1.4" /LENGTH=76 /DNA_ID=CAMNT_0008319801 /DNA_START=1805 /DNA_END=2035 /DNA_ORIENTATION=-